MTQQVHKMLKTLGFTGEEAAKLASSSRLAAVADRADQMATAIKAAPNRRERLQAAADGLRAVRKAAGLDETPQRDAFGRRLPADPKRDLLGRKRDLVERERDAYGRRIV